MTEPLDSADEGRRIRQILAEMRRLEGRDLQLWAIAILISLTLLTGLAALLWPESSPLSFGSRFLPVLLYGLIALVVLYQVYVLEQKRNLRFARAELVRQLMRAESAEEQAVRDPLTGLFNRRHLDHALATEVKRATRTGAALTVLLLDLDDFGAVNKRFGHLEGDRVLSEFAELLVREFRQTDAIARFGGDEFMLLLPDTDLERASIARSRLTAALTRWNSLQDRKSGRISVSVGAAEYRQDETIDELLGRVDADLRQSKAGRKSAGEPA